MTRIKKLLSDPRHTLFEILQHAPAGELEETVALLKQHKPADEVCAALMTFIATAPLTEFETLRDIYRKHCGGQPGDEHTGRA